ncbi:MAG: excinuclease ABC subunit UvrC [Candidatus Cloacimonadota bacterium]|nr:excinuclease ABC subunit UvrC [Candidatus Cloacimonadota bacterium]
MFSKFKEKIKEKLKLVPHSPGVYLMKNSGRKIIYVGKAKDLKKRVSSYFSKLKFDYPKTEVLVSKICEFDYIVTKNEFEALALEDNLIKKYRPRFNIALKDDKKYPYIKVPLNQNFPRITITRKIYKDGAKYFGPFTEAATIRYSIKLLEKIFKLRTCNKKIPRNPEKESDTNRACLNFQINKCDAPCIGNISYEEYRKKINQVILFLKGKISIVTKELEEEMQKASSAQKFEEAAKYRDQIMRIKKLSSRQIVNKYNYEDLDVIGIAREEDICCAVLFKIREGKLIRKEHYFLENTEDENFSAILNRFLVHYYNTQENKAPKILLQTIAEDNELLEEWLKVKLFVPKIGDKQKLVAMARKNAFLYMEEKKLAHLKATHRTVFSVQELKDKLHLTKLPRKIAAFDVSNLYGLESVASMVFFYNGKPKKSQYRRFKIKTVEGINDFLMMEEVVTRYLSHLEDDSFEKPDLILIDGGKGQLSNAKKALNKYPYDIYLFSLAKRLEEVFESGKKEPIIIPKTSQALKLLQRLRDEAHRFAITYHKKLRDRKTTASELDNIPGIGEKRKFELLKHFTSVQKIKSSTVEELSSLPKISKNLANAILENLKKKSNK